MCKRIITHNQLEYYKFILNNHQPSECVVIVDYKMKLKLGIRSREIQRDWYGKWGLSLHGFLVVAQIGDDEKRTEVIDLWSKDTKQDAWFSQNAMLLLQPRTKLLRQFHLFSNFCALLPSPLNTKSKPPPHPLFKVALV